MGDCSLKRLHGGGLGEGSFTGEPERWNGNGNGSIFPCGSSVGGSLLGIQKDIGRRAQRMDMSVHREL